MKPWTRWHSRFSLSTTFIPEFSSVTYKVRLTTTCIKYLIRFCCSFSGGQGHPIFIRLLSESSSKWFETKIWVMRLVSDKVWYYGLANRRQIRYSVKHCVAIVDVSALFPHLPLPFVLLVPDTVEHVRSAAHLVRGHASHINCIGRVGIL